MSRIGNKPVSLLDGVTVAIANGVVTVKGPQGELKYATRPEVEVAFDKDNPRLVVVRRKSDERADRAYHGLTRALIANMVQGVKTGYEKRLEIIGVGYQCAIKGKNLELRLGYAAPVSRPIPAGLKVTCPDATHIVVQGCDKHLVGQFAAAIRAIRKPEPYKGKGIRYVGEYVKIKPGKAAS